MSNIIQGMGLDPSIVEKLNQSKQSPSQPKYDISDRLNQPSPVSDRQQESTSRNQKYKTPNRERENTRARQNHELSEKMTRAILAQQQQNYESIRQTQQDISSNSNVRQIIQGKDLGGTTPLHLPEASGITLGPGGSPYKAKK